MNPYKVLIEPNSSAWGCFVFSCPPWVPVPPCFLDPALSVHYIYLCGFGWYLKLWLQKPLHQEPGPSGCIHLWLFLLLRIKQSVDFITNLYPTFFTEGPWLGVFPTVLRLAAKASVVHLLKTDLGLMRIICPEVIFFSGANIHRTKKCKWAHNYALGEKEESVFYMSSLSPSLPSFWHFSSF